MTVRQERKSIGDFGAYKATDTVVHSVTVNETAQPEVERPVRAGQAVPRPRVVIIVGGHELVVGLAGWPDYPTVDGGLTILAHSAGDVPACAFRL